MSGSRQILVLLQAFMVESLNNLALCSLYAGRMRTAVHLMEELIREDPTAYLTGGWRSIYVLCTSFVRMEMDAHAGRRCCKGWPRGSFYTMWAWNPFGWVEIVLWRHVLDCISNVFKSRYKELRDWDQPRALNTSFWRET